MEDFLLGNVDLDIARISYELFGDSVTKIASDQGCSPSVIEMARKNDEWQKLEFTEDPSLDVAKLKSLSDVPDELLDKARNKQLIIEILKQERLSSFYLRAESLLLRKIMQVTEQLEPNATNAASQLKSLTASLASLTEKTQALIGAKVGDQEGSTTFTVNVMQKFGEPES